MDQMDTQSLCEYVYFTSDYAYVCYRKAEQQRLGKVKAPCGSQVAVDNLSVA